MYAFKTQSQRHISTHNTINHMVTLLTQDNRLASPTSSSYITIRLVSASWWYLLSTKLFLLVFVLIFDQIWFWLWHLYKYLYLIFNLKFCCHHPLSLFFYHADLFCMCIHIWAMCDTSLIHHTYKWQEDDESDFCDEILILTMILKFMSHLSDLKDTLDWI